MGHFGMDFVREVDEPGIILSMLRNPYERIRSLYDFSRSYTWQSIAAVNGASIAKQARFDEFVLCGNPKIRQRIWNAVTRQLLGSRYYEVESDQERAALEAFDVLKSLDWFGITELADESLRRLARVLKIPAPPEMPRLNPTYESAREGVFEREKVLRTVLLRTDDQLIASTNHADILLYDWALRLFLSES
jgi:hypothetical protein